MLSLTLEFLTAFNTIESGTRPLTHKIVGDRQDANYNTEYCEAENVVRLVSSSALYYTYTFKEIASLWRSPSSCL